MGTINNIPPGIPTSATLNKGIVDGHEIANSPTEKILRWGPTFLAEKEVSWPSPITTFPITIGVVPGAPTNPANLG